MEQCAAIDLQRFDEMGLFYSEELWQKHHFELELPGKREFSQVVLDGTSNVQGFWIASRKENNVHFTHRVATRRGASSTSDMSVGSLMGEVSLRIAQEAGCTQAHLTISHKNRGAIRFYRRLGYQIVTGNDLRCWANQWGYADNSLADDSIVITDHYRLVLMRSGI